MCVLILLYVLILLHMCPHPTVCVLVRIQLAGRIAGGCVAAVAASASVAAVAACARVPRRHARAASRAAAPAAAADA